MKAIDSIDFFYKLKRGKRSRVPENLELDIGKEYNIYSYRTGLSYVRAVHECLNIEEVETLIKLKLLWI